MPLKIAIVGRPNVGKSTLFNRLAGKKLAIVDDQPGVTRDRRYATGRIGDIDLELIDTAGFEDLADLSLEARMRLQTEKAIEEADVAFFVVDSREGVTPLDRIFAQILRMKDTPVLLIANKAEGKAGMSGAAEAYQLGFGEPLHLSAEHGEGIGELYDEVEKFRQRFEGDWVVDEDESEDEDDETKPIRIAIIGRPNAGKSTLINKLLGEDRLLVGPEAGITRDSISVDWEYEGRTIRLVDTAGLRRKARVQEKLEKLSTSDTIRAITFAEVVVLVMDEANAFEVQDLQIADLVEREGRGLVYAVSKWDLVENPQSRLTEILEVSERMLPQLRGTPLVTLSGATGKGLERLMPAVLKTYRNWSAKIKTRDLNDWLALAIQRHPPPAVSGKRIKPKYMAQTKGRPPTFVLFAARSYAMPDHYTRYLINSLRESFDMPGVPIRLTVKANSTSNPFVDGDTSDGGKPAGFKRVRAQPKFKPGEKPAHPNRVRQKAKGTVAAAPKVAVKTRTEVSKAKAVKARAMGPSTKPGAAGPGGRVRGAPPARGKPTPKKK
ncbi:ribosome biogenesis GTPase Der [Asticcacaulis benevestitus]|uniref:GTPase Der n=1 Tax=Asticcacaulis benevestitus DSM 16100 = ATCC BAA-896 TaxID=1121022 RepID=V4Q3W2_9CAUL|nr:ribosome biogenesis GTPase Der [Asticcacaulis benevestitus]ESQ94389.1 GTPase Der [Asticcacaulis benevestitus DSM 16100 = ATCC BAA-896]